MQEECIGNYARVVLKKYLSLGSSRLTCRTVSVILTVYFEQGHRTSW